MVTHILMRSQFPKWIGLPPMVDLMLPWPKTQVQDHLSLNTKKCALGVELCVRERQLSGWSETALTFLNLLNTWVEAQVQLSSSLHGALIVWSPSALMLQDAFHHGGLNFSSRNCNVQKGIFWHQREEYLRGKFFFSIDWLTTHKYHDWWSGFMGRRYLKVLRDKCITLKYNDWWSGFMGRRYLKVLRDKCITHKYHDWWSGFMGRRYLKVLSDKCITHKYHDWWSGFMGRRYLKVLRDKCTTLKYHDWWSGFMGRRYLKVLHDKCTTQR